MKSLGQVLLLAGILLLAAALQAKPPGAPGAEGAPRAGGTVLLLDIRGGIGPATRDYLQRGLDKATDTGAAAVVLRIDTPGGLDASTRDINRAILASEVPVIAWVDRRPSLISLHADKAIDISEWRVQSRYTIETGRGTGPLKPGQPGSA